VAVFCGSTDIGQGSDSILAYIVAEELGIRPEDIRVVTADTDLTPVDLGSYSSRVTLMGSVGLSSSEIETEGLRMICNTRDGTTTIDTWRAQAHNALAGGVFAGGGPFSAPNYRLGTQFTAYNVTTGAPAVSTRWDGKTWRLAKRIYGCPYNALYLAAVQSPQSEVQRPYEFAGYASASLTAKVRTGKQLAFTLVGATTNKNRYNTSPGDVIWHEASGLFLVIKTLATNDLTAELLNGFLDTAGTITFPQGEPDFNTGTYYFFGGRDYLPDYPLFGDLTSGSPTITNCGTGEGTFSVGMTADFTNGDGFAVNEQEEFGYAVGATVVSRNEGAFTITMSGNAGATQAKRRLMFRRSV